MAKRSPLIAIGIFLITFFILNTVPTVIFVISLIKFFVEINNTNHLDK